MSALPFLDVVIMGVGNCLTDLFQDVCRQCLEDFSAIPELRANGVGGHARAFFGSSAGSLMRFGYLERTMRSIMRRHEAGASQKFERTTVMGSREMKRGGPPRGPWEGFGKAKGYTMWNHKTG